MNESVVYDDDDEEISAPSNDRFSTRMKKYG